MKMKTKGLVSVFITLFLASQVFAGWVAEQVTTDTEGEETTEITYIQNHKMKNVGSEEIVMIDLEKNLFYMISHSPEQKVYWCGTPEQMREEMEETRKKMEEEYLKQLSPEQRESYEQYQEKMKGETKEPTKEEKLKVEVKKTSETTTIAGYPTRKYQVWVNGELKEELWISTKIKLTDEFDLKKMEKFEEAMSGPEAEESYESSPEYTALMEQGIPLKTIHYYDEEESTVTETIKIEKKQIPNSEFEVPKGYRELSLFELHQLQETMEKKEED